MQKSSKSSDKYYCAVCEYKTVRKSQYDRHIGTAKHKIRINTMEKVPKGSVPYTCECGKYYTHSSSLWNHKRKCNGKQNNINEKSQLSTNYESIDYKDMFVIMLEESQELRKTMLEILPNVGSSISTTNVNSNNNNFNINIFLNEQCKDAMNMTDFIESIQLTLEDMEKIGEQGQTRGMSNILIDKLSSLDVFKRPMHCSDIKKEIIYVKDEDKWEEDKGTKPKLKNALDQITKKSIQALPEISQDPDEFLKTINEVLKDPREDKKIISEVAKKVCV